MSAPERMNAVEITEPGGPEVLEMVETQTPEPRTGEVLIRVAAAGVNRPDVLQRIGIYPVPENASPLPGLEVAGTIVAVGDGISDDMVGHSVCALCNGGGYAQYVAVPAGQTLPVPEGWSMVEAASVVETFFTVWVNVYGHGRLKRNERLLVHGGTSGIGMAAIALGTAFGATVLTTAGSPEKCEFCRERGADLAIDYKRQDFVEEVLEYTDGQGVDVILDIIGGDYVRRNISLLRDRGRHVTIAYLQGNRVEIDLADILRRRLVLTGSTLRPRTNEEKAEIAAGLREHAWPLLAKRAIVPVVDSTYPLEDAAEAHRRMESSAHIGNIVLSVSH